ncbi:MAG: DUF4147 domain-containing protein [Acidobacteria bacterium]|nr:DUF4147 domain-containing protein [Acidobacteriota bacterium]
MNTGNTAMLRNVFRKAVAACSPTALLPPLIETSDRRVRIAGHEFGSGPIYIFGSGKAAVSMAHAALGILGNRVAGGTIVSPETAPSLPAALRHFTGDHPVPTENSEKCGKEMMDALTALAPSDIFVYLLSGGSSALMEVPVSPLTISDVAATTEILLKTGLPIEDVNTIRIHLSRIKGGGLLKQTRAKGIVLVMSDVLNNPLSVIGSGPFWPVKRNHRACTDILQRHGLWKSLPAAVRSFFTHVKEENRLTSQTIPHEIVADNKTFAHAVRKALENRGMPVRVASAHLNGEAADAGCRIANLALNEVKSPETGKKLALIFSGETTVTVRGTGKGGRCQELALAALTELKGNPAITLLAAGSDGRDGPTDAAGAIVNQQVWESARKNGYSPEKFLARNDSYRFFRNAGGLFQTGPTGINLLDIIIVLIHPSIRDNG